MAPQLAKNNCSQQGVAWRTLRAGASVTVGGADAGGRAGGRAALARARGEGASGAGQSDFELCGKSLKASGGSEWGLLAAAYREEGINRWADRPAGADMHFSTACPGAHWKPMLLGGGDHG